MNIITCHYAMRLNGLTEIGEKNATRRIDALEAVFKHAINCADKNQLQQICIDFDAPISMPLFNKIADGEKDNS